MCEKSAGHALEWASAGGARVVYWYFDAHLPLFLFGVYAKAEKADLLVVPELAVLGYPPRDLLLREGVIRAAESMVGRLAQEFADGPPAVLGTAVRNGAATGRAGSRQPSNKCWLPACAPQTSGRPARSRWAPARWVMPCSPRSPRKSLPRASRSGSFRPFPDGDASRGSKRFPPNFFEMGNEK